MSHRFFVTWINILVIVCLWNTRNQSPHVRNAIEKDRMAYCQIYWLFLHAVPKINHHKNDASRQNFSKREKLTSSNLSILQFLAFLWNPEIEKFVLFGIMLQIFRIPPSVISRWRSLVLADSKTKITVSDCFICHDNLFFNRLILEYFQLVTIISSKTQSNSRKFAKKLLVLN